MIGQPRWLFIKDGMDGGKGYGDCGMHDLGGNHRVGGEYLGVWERESVVLCTLKSGERCGQLFRTAWLLGFEPTKNKV